MTAGAAIEIETDDNWDKFIKMLRRVISFTPSAEDDLVDKFGDKLLRQIRYNASHPPGPQVQTGEYVQSWYKKKVGPANVIVNSDAPQKDRLEFGFVGQDSLGRHYHQPPFPHIGPAVEQLQPEFVEAHRKMIVKMVEVK